MADNHESSEDNQASASTEAPEEKLQNVPSSDDEQDVHYCGRCKLSFTDLSEYIKHKANKVCREANKSTLTEVVNKLPISANQSPEKSNEQSSNATDSSTTDACKKTQESETTDKGSLLSSLEKRVEVQFLEPLVASSSKSGSGDEGDSKKAAVGAKSDKPSKRHKRKNSHPKTTRKRKSSSTSGSSHEKTKEPRSKKSSKSGEESITVHIPESQLVHLNSGSATSSSSSPPVRKQGATSVFVPIYLNPPSKVYKCQRCPAVFKTLEEKDEHNKMHKKEFKCTLCAKSFFTASGFEQHRLNESHAHPCNDCGKIFTSVVQLKKHKTAHSTDRPFNCNQCEKAFCSSANLRSHQRTVHATEKNHKCPECGKAFARKDKMKRHSLIHFPDTRPTFTCPFRSHTGCMKTFYREDKLKRHLFTHSKDKPFKCEECNKGYARRDNLNDHMRIHTGIYSHNCQLCKKGFLGPHKLKKHMRSAHRQSNPDLLLKGAEDRDTHPPTMVPLNESKAAPLTTSKEEAVPGKLTAPVKAPRKMSSADEEAEPSSPELPSEGEDDEAFDVSGSDSGEERSSEEEQQCNDEEPVPTSAPPTSSPATTSDPPRPPLPQHGPLPRVRPVPRVSATPQPFIPPPLPPGLHATAELMAFTQELFNVVGRFQS